MALNLGELVATLRADDTKLDAGLSGGKAKLKAFGDGAKTALATAGAAAAAAIGVGIAQNLDIGAGRAKLAAQLDLTAEDSARIGAVAGQVYADNWGESLDDVNAAIRAVGANIGDVTRMSASELKGVTEAALALSDTFDVDLAQATEAAGKMIKNGLAKNSTEAFDVMTRGFQLGLDKSGDFLDTINEYSPQFAKLGIDGTHALSILQAGLQAGARDTDTIADAFKEFSLRSIDGSTQTAAGFKAAGLDAKKMASEIAKGGPAAQSATFTTLQALAQIKDPIKQNAAGVALFGTQWEDTLRQILPSVARAEEGMEGVNGATQRMADTAGTSGKGKIESLKRGIEQWIQAQTNASSTLGTTVAAVAAFGAPALTMAGSLGQVAAGLAAMNAGSALSAMWSGIVRAGTLAWTGAQWLLNAAMTANPIGLVILAIVALVAIIVIAWKHSETFRNIVTGAFHWVLNAVRSAWNWIKGNWPLLLAILTGPIGLAVRWIIQHWDQIVATAKGLPGKIGGIFSGIGNLLKNAGRRLIQGFIDGIKAMFAPLQDTLGWVTDHLPDWKGPEDKDAKILRRSGRLVMRGFLTGLEGEYSGVRRSLSGLTDSLAGSPVAAIPAPRVGGSSGVGVSSGAGRREPIILRFRSDDRAELERIKRIVRVEGGGDVVVAFGS